MKRNKKNEQPYQLSLWGKFDDLTDSEILSRITKKEEALDDDWSGNYRLEQIFNRLTPSTRKVAESVIELYRRRDATDTQRCKMLHSKAVAQYMAPVMAEQEVEEFWIIGLNKALKAINRVRISVGGLDCCMADVRVIFYELIKMRATNFICIHNHPSGNLQPSREDRNLTSKIIQAGKIMSINMTDHLILSPNGDYFSFQDEGLM